MVLQIRDVVIQNSRERLRRQRLVGDDAVNPVDKFGRKPLPNRNQRDVLQLARKIGPLHALDCLKSEIRIDLAHHLASAQVARQKDQALFEIDRGVVSQPQNPLVQDAQQQPGHRRRRLFDFVEQHQRQVAFLAGHSVELLLGQHRLGLAMPEIARRRSNEFGHLVLHLELTTIDLEYVFLAAVQDLGQGFHGFGLARARRSEQQEHPHRTPFRCQAGLVHLDVGDDHTRGRRLAHHLLRENGRQILCRVGCLLLRSGLCPFRLVHPGLRLNYGGLRPVHPGTSALIRRVWFFHCGCLS